MFEIYKPGGGFRFSFALILLVVMAVAVGLAFLYQLLLEWIPFIYVSFLLTLGFGAAMGGLGRLVVKAGHVRNVLIALFIAIGIGGTGYVAKYWFQYEAFLWAVAEFNYEQLNVPIEDAYKMAQVEYSFWRHIEIRVEEGWHLRKGAQISGVFVYLVWLIEAGIIFYLTFKIPFTAVFEPYSEKIGQWAHEEKIIMVLPIDNPEMVTQIKQANVVDDLLTIPIPKSDDTDQFATYAINSIPGHELEDAYLTVKLMTISYDKHGNEQKKEKPLVKYAILSKEQLDQLNENAELLNEAIAAYQEAKYSAAEEKDQESTDEDSEDSSPGETVG